MCCWVARTGRGLYSSDEIDEDDRLDIEEVLYAIRNGWCGGVEVDQSKVEAVVDMIESMFDSNDEADTAEDECIPHVKEEVIEVVEETSKDRVLERSEELIPHAVEEITIAARLPETKNHEDADTWFL